MAVLGQDQVTLTDLTDISASTIYYYQQTSTLAAPAKPTVKTPTGWVTTEPSVDTTKSLYSSTRTDWSNGEFTWSDVSLSSSYEAAKAAYNKAVSAQDTANSADSKVTYTYGTCATAETTATKAVVITNFPTLYTGARCSVKFTYATSVASPTISINSGTAHAIHAYGSNLIASSYYNWTAGATVDFIFDGTYWNMIDSGSLSKASSAQTTATTAYSRASYLYGTCATAATTVAKVATVTSFPSLYTGATCAIKFTYANNIDSPTLNVSSTGAKPIFAYGAALTIASGYSWTDNSTVSFVYDGTNWVMVDPGSLDKANEANSIANSAIDTANGAQTAANTANDAATAAATAAQTAQNSADAASAGVTAANGKITDLTSTTDTLRQNVKDLTDDSVTWNNLSKNVRVSDDLIVIGVPPQNGQIAGDVLSLELSSGKISFLKGSNEVAYVSGDKLYINSGVFVTSLRIGNFEFVPRSNGNMSFKKVG